MLQEDIALCTSGGDELRIVLLGKTGDGKSSVGNTILGEHVFTTTCSPQSQTQICKRHEKVINGRRVVVIDTPGMFDIDRSEKDLRAEIISCLVECAPGPHLFILVLKIERHTRENQKATDTLLKYFGQEVLDHTVVLFTHGDDLDEGMTIHDFVKQSNVNNNDHQTLNDFVMKCGNRVHVVDNKYWNNNTLQLLQIPCVFMLDDADNTESEWQVKTEQQNFAQYRSNTFQIRKLMKSINEILLTNQKPHFQNKSLDKIGKGINEELQILLEENVTQNPAELKPDILIKFKMRARERVRTKLEKLLAGVATGTLLGALLGVGVGLAAPAVLVAGLIRAGWRKLTDQRPSGRPQVQNTDVGAAALAGTAVVGGISAEIALAGVEAAVIGAGAATGIGAGVGAGLLLLYGAGKGLKSGYDASKKSDNPEQAAKNVTQALGNKGHDVLKACWNLGKAETGTETKHLLGND